MPKHMKTTTIAWYQQPSFYKLETPLGTFEGVDEQTCYDAFLAFAESEPHTLVNALMPQQAKPLLRGSGR